MQNKQESQKNQVNLSVSIPKGYIVVTPGALDKQDTLDNGVVSNLDGIMKMVKLAEKNNVALSQELVQSLITLDEKSFKEIQSQFKEIFKAQKGQFLRSVFATGSDITEESFTLEDFFIQINHYFISYGLGEVDHNIFVMDETRKVQIANASKRSTKQELNNTFRIIDVKTDTEFFKEVEIIATSPIVWGTQQLEFIKEANRIGILAGVLTNTDVKVKENLFEIMKVTGKEFFRDNNVLKTATDILRYCYFVSEEDFKALSKGTKFSLKTSDKKVIMASLNRISKRDVKNTFGDMKPYKSQWLSVSKNLNPGSAKFNRFSDAQGIFDYLRNGGNVETFNAVTQDLIKNKNWKELTKHLSKKPGELLRSLDMIIRNSNKNEVLYLISVLDEIKLNPKLITQVKKWLEYRTENALTSRTFKVKGKPVTVDNKPLDTLKTKRTMKVVQALRGIMVRHLEGKTLFKEQLKSLEQYEASQANKNIA